MERGSAFEGANAEPTIDGEIVARAVGGSWRASAKRAALRAATSALTSKAMGHALLVIDVQNDFLPGGALAVPDGDRILPRVGELIESGDFDLVVATRDWHPPDHSSFADQGGPWPPHCVQGTHGAEISEELPRERIDVVVDKGDDPGIEGYSGFEQTELAETLRERGIDRVTIVGLATDYCVRHTAADALASEFEVVVDRGGVRGIDAEPGDSERALGKIADAGAQIAGPTP